MKLFELGTVSKIFLFAILAFLIGDLLIYACKEYSRHKKLKETGNTAKAVFTNIKIEIIKRKMNITADLTYNDKDGNPYSFSWHKGLFDEEVLLFRNADAKKLPVTVLYDPAQPMNMYVEECYNPKKHLLIIGLCVLSFAMFAYTLFVL